VTGAHGTEGEILPTPPTLGGNRRVKGGSVSKTKEASGKNSNASEKE